MQSPIRFLASTREIRADASLDGIVCSIVDRYKLFRRFLNRNYLNYTSSSLSTPLELIFHRIPQIPGLNIRLTFRLRFRNRLPGQVEHPARISL